MPEDEREIIEDDDVDGDEDGPTWNFDLGYPESDDGDEED